MTSGQLMPLFWEAAAILELSCSLCNSLKLSLTNIWGFRSNFVEFESFLESNSPDILALCETNFDDSIDSGNFLVRGYLPLIWKIFYYSYAWFCNLFESPSFCTGRIFRKLCGFLLMFSTSFTSKARSALPLFPLSITIDMHGFWFYFI